ncbi:unnamed protein product [Rhizoctonia solani]|uniref:Uncharacterized protein n=3 Tax=Rhizoctonia solani TaxID=456999 RepID=A0A8H3GP54_9AGAM|nr:pheromone receptor [Rhizoctonia solani AG-3 Rhs1AP]KEP49812.1 pheromone receptor [Rhizoctonia solani 123E]CAE6460482.1 unnamed protein product [Rhizoctonia solani]CAE6518655.1 unnamed protein product [Rhizoctonia solani]
MSDAAFPAFCALALVLLLLVLPTHIRARNSGTLLFIGWTFISILILLVNSLVWAGNLSNPAPVWCDISSKLIIGANSGIPAASLCISRRLYLILHPRYAHSDASTKRRAIMLDLATGLGVPALAMILHTVVQGHRYDIIENIGCYPTTYATLLAVPMVYIWPILLASTSFIYSSLTVTELVNRRRQFSSVLSSSRSGLNASQYFRLMALAATDVLFSLPLSVFVLITNLRMRQNPWISWEDTHQNFGRINFFPWASIGIRPSFFVLLQIVRWSPPALGVVFFLYFGIAGEATVEYRRWFWAIAGLFGVKPKSGPGYSANRPNYVVSHPPTAARNVAFPPPRPTNSLDRIPKKDVESQFQSLDSLGLDNLNKPGDLGTSKPPGLN